MIDHMVWVESFDYLKFGNKFSGSSGAYNFKIFPEKDESRLRMETWEGPNCCEKTPDEDKKEYFFSYDPEGLEQAKAVIAEEIKDYWIRREKEELKLL